MASAISSFKSKFKPIWAPLAAATFDVQFDTIFSFGAVGFHIT